MSGDSAKLGKPSLEHSSSNKNEKENKMTEEERMLILYQMGQMSEYDIVDHWADSIAMGMYGDFEAQETLDFAENESLTLDELEAENGTGQYVSVSFDIDGARELQRRNERNRRIASQSRSVTAPRKKTASKLAPKRPTVQV